MLETPHVVVGAAIAVKIVHPALAIPLAFASHFVLEKIPHWNPHLNHEKQKYGHPTKSSTTIVLVDATLALLTGSFIAYKALPNTALAATIFFACFASILPDLIEAPYFFLNVKSKIITRWISFQKTLQENTGVIHGLINQLVIVAAGLWWIFS